MTHKLRFSLTSLFGAVLIGAILATLLWKIVPGHGADNPRQWRATDGGGAPDPPTFKKLEELIQKLKPLHKKITPPGPDDWLAQHEEPGQTFRQYLTSNPITPRGRRDTLYIQPLGDFTKTQRKIITLTAEFMEAYFNTKVAVKEDLPLSIIPAKAQRVHPSWGMKQILSTYVLDEVLRPRLPHNAAACIAFTASDLYPDPTWNFVFGQASLIHRVGVWSIYRNGDPDRSPAEFRLCLLRTLKTATHETGHMFGMYHCTLYECNMCGSNHREESDRRPITLCPECLPKVIWASAADPVSRFRKLAAFSKTHEMEAEEASYTRSLRALGAGTEPEPGK